MKKSFSSGFGSFFGRKQYSPESSPASSTNVTTTAFSQPHVLKRKMQEEKLTHAETVTANISPVRLENSPGRMVLYFCPMKTIEILKTVVPGDGGSLPAEVKLEGLVAPGDCLPGLYTLKNVVLTSNGTMQVIATDETVWEKYSTELV